MSKVFQFFRSQWLEIDANYALRYYGFFLTCVHFATYLFWKGDTFDLKKIFDSEPVCWAIYQNCAWARPFLFEYVDVLISFYFFSALAVSLFFLFKKTKLGYWGLFALTGFKFLIFIHDYRLMGNYHYMPFIATLFYLLVPNKMQFGKLIIVGFYLGAGIIKFNTDWLSGMALVRNPIISGKLLEWSCAYVILLEICFSFLLLSRNKIVFWTVFAQFVIFHLFSFHIVGYFYPTIMFCLLTLFVLDKIYLQTSLLVNSPPIKSKKIGIFALVFFAVAQVYPAVFHPDSAVTGEGRILSLNMLDGRAICENKLILRYKFGSIEESINLNRYGIRVQCDPVIYYYELKSICQKLKSEESFTDLDFSLYGKRVTDSSWLSEFQVTNFCKQPPKLSWLGKIK